MDRTPSSDDTAFNKLVFSVSAFSVDKHTNDRIDRQIIDLVEAYEW